MTLVLGVFGSAESGPKEQILKLFSFEEHNAAGGLMNGQAEHVRGVKWRS